MPECATGVAFQKIAQPCTRGYSCPLRRRRIAGHESGESAAGKSSRSEDVISRGVSRDRHNAMTRGVGKFGVIQKAVGAVEIGKRLECQSGMMRKAAEIVFLTDHAPSNEHLIGAGAGLLASLLCSPQYGGSKDIPQAVEFKGGTGLTMPGKVVDIRSREAEKTRDDGCKRASGFCRACALRRLDGSRIPPKCSAPHGHSTVTPRNKRHSPRALDGL